MAEAGRERLTLSAGLRGNNNSFGIIRLVLASSVIFSHAFNLGGWVSDPFGRITRGQETIGGLAVVGFFVVSGYLITKSGARNDVVQFMWRRSLRILPAFWLALAVGALVVGPLAWVMMDRSLGSYFTLEPGGPASYLKNNVALSIHQWGIFDIFHTSTPYGSIAGQSVFNGSLWTLIYEWRAYLIIAALVLIGAIRRAPVMVVVAAAVVYLMALALHFRPGAIGVFWPGFADRYLITLTLAFLIGGTMAVLADRIVLDGRIAMAAGAGVILTLALGHWILIGYACYAYVLLYVAARLPEGFRRIGAKNDYSYGMYVYGFLVQQFTAFLGWHLWGYLPWVLATLVVTFGLAYISWHVVEKPSLALKDWGPGKGIAHWRDWLVLRVRRPAKAP